MTKKEIYISSSWKNRDRVRTLAGLLRLAGFTVYDFTDPKCRDTEEIPPEKFPEQYDPDIHVYGDYLDRVEWRSAVECNRRAIERCAACILVLPCGNDAHADWALAVGFGKPSVVVGTQRHGERSPVHLWADAIVPTDDDAVLWVRALLGEEE